MTKDAIVFIGVLWAGSIALAIDIGMQHQPYVYPVAEGQQVVSTIDSKAAQVCVYANSYGRALQKRKAVKL